VVEYARKYISVEHGGVLAIGDGANDVGMILKAHVGVGISGKEGAQAAKAADFALPQFRFLRRLCFIYGRESLRRNAYYVYFMLFKNVVFATPSMYFSYLSRFSCLDAYEPFIKTAFNTIFTSMPIVLYTIFDRELPYYHLMSCAGLYKCARGWPDLAVGYGTFWYWVFIALYGACFCGILPFYLLMEHPSLGGSPMLVHVGILVFFSVVTSVNAIILVDHNGVFWFTILFNLLNTLAYLITWYFTSEYDILGIDSPWHRSFYQNAVDSGAQWWFTLLIITIINCLPHGAITLRKIIFPDTIRIVKERAKLLVDDVIVMPTKDGDEGAVVVPHKRATNTAGVPATQAID